MLTNLNVKLYHDTITHIKRSKPFDLIRIVWLALNSSIDICQFFDMLLETNPIFNHEQF